MATNRKIDLKTPRRLPKLTDEESVLVGKQFHAAAGGDVRQGNVICGKGALSAMVIGGMGQGAVFMGIWLIGRSVLLILCFFPAALTRNRDFFIFSPVREETSRRGAWVAREALAIYLTVDTAVHFSTVLPCRVTSPARLFNDVLLFRPC